MPRRQQHPVEEILGYFKTCSLETAELVLALIKGTVAERKAHDAANAKLAQSLHAAIADPNIGLAYPGEEPPAAPAPATPKPTKPRKSRTRRMTATSQPPVRQDVAEAAGEADIPLPGMQAEVGDDDLNQDAPE